MAEFQIKTKKIKTISDNQKLSKNKPTNNQNDKTKKTKTVTNCKTKNKVKMVEF